jgi:GH24 family phage-related lysozyme (muramidase)
LRMARERVAAFTPGSAATATRWVVHKSLVISISLLEWYIMMCVTQWRNDDRDKSRMAKTTETEKWTMPTGITTQVIGSMTKKQAMGCSLGPVAPDTRWVVPKSLVISISLLEWYIMMRLTQWANDDRDNSRMATGTETEQWTMPTGISTQVIGSTIQKQAMGCSLGPVAPDTRDNSRMTRSTETEQWTMPTGISTQVIGSTIEEQAMGCSLGPTASDTRWIVHKSLMITISVLVLYISMRLTQWANERRDNSRMAIGTGKENWNMPVVK